ncbi:hypothetical protein [Marivita geojedonensis]|uniref:Uncharacterized protein n=1 Tax=Marivita geojedonensis TaxID=1123756 RepID=A0A1X4NEJ3_9RHOB|nr:hypothetical protein [Marivita geojedonensis]OSQ45276.1 hypothetical protein MGEO_18325 [Marivita geojedonensis]PRY73901.1 hypothetical protein CLV76_12622 [Marivita geojedonensis]
MTAVDAMAVHAAILPFVTAWTEMDPDLEVISSKTDGWDNILAGLGIRMRTGFDQLPEHCAVITDFDALDRLPRDELKAWALTLVQRCRPGAILVLGGDNPNHPEAPTGTLPQIEGVEFLRAAGVERIRIIDPIVDTTDERFLSDLYGISRRYAIVGQTKAYGKPFDVFSAPFSMAPEIPSLDRIKRADLRLQQHFFDVDAKVQDVDSTLQNRLCHLDSALQKQAAEINHLREHVAALETKLKRATRRRGLRKLVFDLKSKWRSKTETRAFSSVVKKEGDISSGAQIPERIAHAANPAAPPTLDPIPLSSREVAIRNRLLEPEAE